MWTAETMVAFARHYGWKAALAEDRFQARNVSRNGAYIGRVDRVGPGRFVALRWTGRVNPKAHYPGFVWSMVGRFRSRGAARKALLRQAPMWSR